MEQCNSKTALLVYTMSQAIRNRFSIDTMVKAAGRSGVALIPVRSDDIYNPRILRGIDDYNAFSYAKSLPVISIGVDDSSDSHCYITLSDGRTFRSADLSFAILRGPFRMLHEHLDAMGIPTFNDSAFAATANSKIATLRIAAKLGIPFMPATVARDISAFQTELPIVTKPDDGHGGNGVRLIDSDHKLDGIMSNQNGLPRMLQQVADTHGHDMRVYVLDGKIIAAMMRTGSGFLSNYTKGGKADVVDIDNLDDNVINAVNKIIDEFGAFFGGIDFLMDGNRWVLGEIEDAVGCRMIYDKIDLDPFSMFIDSICQKTQQS